MTEKEYDFWRGWHLALDQEGAYYDYHLGNTNNIDLADGYVSACQYWNMPVVDQEEVKCNTSVNTSLFVK